MSIRLRVAAVFALALAVAFALGSWLLVSQLRTVMLRSVDAGLSAQVSQAHKLLNAAESSGRLADGDYAVQFIDATGRVRAAGEDAGQVPLVTQAQQRAARRAPIADASHELRTPFAVLSAELELAAKPGRNRQELADAVTSASEETARLRRLTDALLLATSDEERLTVRTEAVDLGDLLTHAAEQAAQRGTATAVTCQVDVPAGLSVRVDPGQIRRAVDNLIDNALRFAPAGSQIVVSARADGQDVAIEVADAGPGFSADYLPHAFERFSRPDSVRARTAGGAGLGLSIVMAIAQAHGGVATARDQPPGGAVVRIDLPRAA